MRRSRRRWRLRPPAPSARLAGNHKRGEPAHRPGRIGHGAAACWRFWVDRLSLAAGAAPTAPARAQDYPTRPVTIVNPFAPGGGTDLLARMVASKLEQRLGKSFVIENKTGAGSHHRGGRGAEVRAGRLHAADGADADHGGQRLALQEPAVRAAHRFRAARAAGADAVRADGQSGSAGEVGARADRLRQGQSRQADVCIGRAGRAASSVHGDCSRA